ncbi:ribokinase [Paracoccus denitrificans]|jgi:ribokinase|uniref:Ribokinase n=1 Tax=Paracoccus denitrificans (strain Pd 1222) TaxID=318586 RepID=A1B4F5_PARDP|nr:ribokinase [Paracoccus denitrificans]ABL70399.1 Ribokinase [Paracoccus denitrificans PD1222]MBB4627308.1 ribokinase [Paracoccus denitrificans]MCU7427919.1 ribokinase [Paracoccus denitrificans]QAR25743.1 ribokinase [Paracoccus denitrificans]UPV94643.1 ribokinase [Paracoccus denitrificans]
MTIYNLGSINIDHVYRLPALPRPGETLHAQSYAQGLGGKGANQSVAAARAGADVVHLGAMAASDGWVLGRLAEAGVQTSAIARLPDIATGHAIILVDTAGENSIVLHGGANLALPAALASGIGFGPDDILLMQNETNLQAETAALARRAGARVIYSAAPFSIAALREVLPHVSILSVNEIEARDTFAAFGEDLPVEGLLVTRGAEGAEFRDLRGGQAWHQPAFAVEAVDTTGAGDCFTGWFAAGLARGENPPTALRHAAAAAALQVTRRGAGDAMPDRTEVLAFLKARG